MGQSLTCEVTAAAQTTVASAAISPLGPRTLSRPGIAGDPRLRGTLSCSRGEWYDEAADRYAVAYRWLRRATPIAGATAATYQVTAGRPRHDLACEVRAEKLAAAAGRRRRPRRAASSPRPSPAIPGCARRSRVRAALGTTSPATATRSRTTGCATLGDHRRDRRDVHARRGRRRHSISCTVRAESRDRGLPERRSTPTPQNRVAAAGVGRRPVAPDARVLARRLGRHEADRYAPPIAGNAAATSIAGATSATYAITPRTSTARSAARRAEKLTEATSA